jgi:hypothetical protein
MVRLSNKLSISKYMKGANRSDTRRQKVNQACRVSRRAYLRAVRREGKQQAQQIE